MGICAWVTIAVHPGSLFCISTAVSRIIAKSEWTANVFWTFPLNFIPKKNSSHYARQFCTATFCTKFYRFFSSRKDNKISVYTLVSPNADEIGTYEYNPKCYYKAWLLKYCWFIKCFDFYKQNRINITQVNSKINPPYI